MQPIIVAVRNNVKKINAVIKDNVLNVIHNIAYEFEDSISDEGIDFMLTEGNDSCDCNRGQKIYGESFCCSGDRFSLISFNADNSSCKE